MNEVKLSKTLSYILRHQPEDFGLEINPDGSIEVDRLIEVLQQKRFPNLNRNKLKRVVENDEKGRFSFLSQGEYIRANYGHSIAGVHPDYKSIEPPRLLYHGTFHRLKDKILQEGLKSMSRNFVHLSCTKKEAIKVGKRREEKPLILKIKAKKAEQDGQKFYLTGKGIYLTDDISPRYIEI